MVYAQHNISSGEWHTQTTQGFDIQTDVKVSTRRPDLILIIKKKKKRTCKIVDFAVPANHRVKLKESEKKNKYLDLTKEL